MIFAFILSFFKWDYLTTPVFVGLDNYFKIIEDLIEGFQGDFILWVQVPFFTALRNILFYTALVIPTQTFLAIILATLSNQKLKGTTFYKLAYFLPGTTCAVIISLLFIWLFREQGIINYSVQQVVPGFGPDWIHEADYVIPAMALVAIWGTSGHFTVSFLAALQSIPEDLYEAAALDGAGRFKQFRYITLPMLKPMTFYVLIMGLIGAIQMFDLAFVLGGGVGGGPGGRGYTPTMDIYNEAFIRLRVGLAAAKSFALFILVFAITYFVRKRYEVYR
jgi:multiple sugar transport system permease protein